MRRPNVRKFCFLKQAVSGFVIGLMSLSVQAASVNPCDVHAWKITGAVQSSAYTSGNPLPSVGPISATSCAGVFEGNNDAGGTASPSPNLGYRNDGLLNGQGGLLSPTQFISPSQLMDLENPGQFVDPGWIMLGTLGGNSGELSYASVGSSPGFSLSQVIRYTQTQTSNVGGTWLLEVDADIISILAAQGLFDRSFFDHLAFSVKSSTGWAVYDFDFNLINAAAPGAFNLNVPYTIGGTWTMNSDFFNRNGNGQDISHLAVWARDPLSRNDIPLPGTVFLLGLGLLVMGAIRRSRT